MELTITESPMEVQEEKELDLLKPHLYEVVLLNDDYTPIKFVIFIIQDLFFKTEEEANLLALEVHYKGEAVIAKYPLEVALMKVKRVHEMAKAQEHPLKAITRKD